VAEEILAFFGAFIAGLRQRGMTAPGVIDGAMNGSMFVGYVEQILVPAMKVIVFRCPPGA
jgi:hypothetical protein